VRSTRRAHSTAGVTTTRRTLSGVDRCGSTCCLFISASITTTRAASESSAPLRSVSSVSALQLTNRTDRIGLASTSNAVKSDCFLSVLSALLVDVRSCHRTTQYLLMLGLLLTFLCVKTHSTSRIVCLLMAHTIVLVRRLLSSLAAFADSVEPVRPAAHAASC